ncbi:MAG: hypothetical protein J3Q66DRAFT_345553, partial [Benniella sp.]
IPVLDRLVCTLVQHIVDSFRTDYGRFVFRYLTAFMGPVVLLLTVEASRVGNSGSLLACMPFTAIVTCFFGGGTYLLFFFVPLMNYARKRIQKTGNSSHPPPSDIPLARVYAILVANALHMASILYMLTLGPTHEGEAHSRALQRIIVNAILMVSLWFIYTPLTWFFEGRMESPQGTFYDVRAAHVAEEIKAHHLLRRGYKFMGVVNCGLCMWTLWEYWGGSTPFWHLIYPFSGSFRYEHKEYASAYFLTWDLVGAIGASWLWVLSDVEHLTDLVLLIPLSFLFTPGAALMSYASFRERQLVDMVRFLSAPRTTRKKKAQ